MSVMVDAKLFGGIQQDDDTYLAITVTNRGSAATTITHMVLYDYPTRFGRWAIAHLGLTHPLISPPTEIRQTARS